MWAISTDASDYAVGAVLQQRCGVSWQQLAFYSKKLSPTAQKRSPYDRELNAIYETVQHFKHIFEG